MRSHPAHTVQTGIERFLAAFRASFGTDHEAELAEPALCEACHEYPAAYERRCFRCHARRLPS